MRSRLLLGITTLAVVLGLAAMPAQAKEYKFKVTGPQAPAWLGAGGIAIGGSDTVTARAFWVACNADRAAVAAGQPPRAVAAFLTSPANGWDAYVVDLGKETMGAFALKGPGAAGIGPEVQGIQVTEYDLDMDFYTDPTVDPTRATTTGCQDANEKATGSSHRCYAHRPTPDEKTPCISGYKDSKGKTRGARYVLVSASLNLKGPMDIVLTAP